MAEKYKTQWVAGSNHTHGFWTSTANKHELRLNPFELDCYVKTCMSFRRDFQAIVDIMSHVKGKNPFQERRYHDLIETGKSNKFYDIEKSSFETTVYFKDGRKFHIPRSQEVITDNPLAHILVLGLGERDNISGGQPALETLLQIKDRGGYAFLNHPLVCKAFTQEEIMEYYERELILGTEFNGGITIGNFLKPFAYALKNNPPLKDDNEQIKNLKEKVLLVANDDSHCSSDVQSGAYTEYLIEENPHLLFTEKLTRAMQNEIQDGLRGNYVKPHFQYSKWWSMWYHGLCGAISKDLPEI